MMTKTKNLQFVFILLVIAGVLAFSYWNISQARIYNPTGAATADANTWTGLQTFTGFISSASSTVASNLHISGVISASSSMVINGVLIGNTSIGVSAATPNSGAVYVEKTGGVPASISFDTSNADPAIDFNSNLGTVNWTIGYDLSESGFVLAQGGNPTAGNARLFLADGGNITMANNGGSVGIGTTSPVSILSVTAGANATSTLHLGKNTTGYGTCVQHYNPAGSPFREYWDNSGVKVEEAGSCNGN